MLVRQEVAGGASRHEPAASAAGPAGSVTDASGSRCPWGGTPAHCPRSGYGACLSLVRASDKDARDQRRHFFAAAEARRRLLVENARRQARQKEKRKFLVGFVPKKRIVLGGVRMA
jgi:hypothetical protein